MELFFETLFIYNVVAAITLGSMLNVISFEGAIDSTEDAMDSVE